MKKSLIALPLLLAVAACTAPLNEQDKQLLNSSLEAAKQAKASATRADAAADRAESAAVRAERAAEKAEKAFAKGVRK